MSEIKVPELAESITEGTISEWLVKKGDKVEKGDAVVELETDKVNVEVNTDYAGVITEIVAQEGDDVEVGDVIATLDENGKAGGSDSDGGEKQAPAESEKSEDDVQTSPEPVKAEKEDKQDDSSDSSQDVIASPAARKRARELGIDLNDVDARDPLGRIRPEDVDSAAKGGNDQKGSKPAKKEEPKTSEKAEFDKPVERVKMSRRRQTIANRLVEVQQEAAMLTTFNEVDMSAIMKLRNERKEVFKEKHGVKLGFMSFFTKAVIGALKEFPLLNAEIQGKEIVKKKFYDIGIAVSTEDGLVVPVVRDADKMDFAGVEKEIGNLGEKAINKELSLDELQGGTFTITNGGTFGSMLSTPILNSPQVGILGMHNIQKRPVVMPDDSIEVRPMMYLAVSYDHRIVDGKEAVQFLVRIKELLEDPYDLLLEG
ncbi:dihydrolipoyllysine-residue succinyltransferase component of 2-oxoglutarate dehydrogenase complex [Lentibacillus kapialis]|uniref:Dihydrolipoyllysine-residue succinyltransferase component of 2-oxoglutarate dehydrogenase complex n=1 Tax=Lentibacillus kapialis TaxID=340214 RepID=A0A917UVN7_9BACI|nr:2-oxoglutarate dehydrogenase complex dihydrolipoyllysine-residue succinyltransferase [Lentibacillus kapialis]GGJ88118.1 dihydrolipoyllysine-residue succinyltransferase component of 2-oxoglutarate dehydrogenase complex [Lentibacillus kapialis]